jgi:hypothetical protein
MTKKILTPEQKAALAKIEVDLEADRKAEVSHDIVMGWMERARKQKFDTLQQFLKEVHDDIPNSYGNICHKIGIAAIASMYAFEHSDQGGITGFQASHIMWEVTCAWNNDYDPQRLVKYKDMLYPQYEHKFTSISKDTFKWMQAEARKILSETNEHMHPHVREHMESIIMGNVPFGYSLED